MKSTVLSKEFNLPFEVVYNSIKGNINESGFLLLHEIDTQKIVSKHNIHIRELKQLLFFKPKYIIQILDQDSLAINDIPLKIVIYKLENGLISVSCQNPIKDLIDYELEANVSIELFKSLENILRI